ncbi:MAG: hypothetical protein WAN27_11820 [Xanthobacteraceae bacterium]|jgi:hypothetical protein
MTSVAQPSPHGKSHADTPGERDLLLSALRVAAARAKLEVNLFETVGISLRQKAIDCAGAIEWLKRENVLQRLQFGPEAVR